MRTPRPSTCVASFRELNSRKVDPSLVKQSVLHYLSNPEELTVMQFTNLGMASSRHCDIHLTVEVCEQVGGEGGASAAGCNGDEGGDARTAESGSGSREASALLCEVAALRACDRLPHLEIGW